MLAKERQSGISSSSPDSKTLMNAWNKQNLEGFVALLDNPNMDFREAEAFSFALKQATTSFGIKPVDLATEFGVNSSTITRWASEKTMPIPPIRPLVVQWVRDRIKERAEGIALK